MPIERIVDCRTGDITEREIEALPAPVPASVNPVQFKLALLAAGKYQDAVDAVTRAGLAAEIYWTGALAFERDHSLILAIFAELELDEAAIDDLFRDAATR